MESKSDNAPVVAIVGETASGKSTLALELAQQFDGEIICADSRTVYRGLDIGTAKPSLEDQKKVRHHLIDLVDPSERFTAADFQRRANAAIKDIASRGKMPFLVGGTGLYVDAILYNFTFSGAADLVERERLQRLSVSELQAILAQKGITLPTNDRNPRHLVRAIETGGVIVHPKELRQNTLVIGLKISRDQLAQNIMRRTEMMIEQGLVDEAKQAAEKYGWDAPGLQSTSYKAIRQYIEGNCTLDEAKTLFVQNDLHLAKRQRTWFRRNHDIYWISKKEESVDLITTLLNK